jgi:hypothetical protein
MYINPFLAGVLTTVLVEIIGLLILAIIATARKIKYGD